MIRAEDRHWYYGQVGDRLCGRFPRSNIGSNSVQLPAAEPYQSYFITVAPFTPQQEGDLAFYKNEILVGIDRIDANWWNGRTADGRQGIFFCSFLGFYLFVVIIIIINRRVRMYRYISYFLSLASTARFALPSSGS